MNVLVIYDSTYGNTEALAKAVATGLDDEVKLLSVAEADLSRLRSLDLLVVASPTQGGRPTAALRRFLASMPADSLASVAVAAFDTRIGAEARGFPLRLLMRVIGYAAPRIANTLQAKGGRLAAPPEGFIVEGKEGPLAEGELDRARAWATALAGGVSTRVPHMMPA